jgi:hypothetical protein
MTVSGASKHSPDETVIASEAKQSMPQGMKNGLLRRFAPRNDEKERTHA